MHARKISVILEETGYLEISINFLCKQGRVTEAYKLLILMLVGLEGCDLNAATYLEFEEGLKVSIAM